MQAKRKIVITGTTKGLGLALAKRLLEEGHEVFGCGRGRNPLPENPYPRFHYTRIDVSDYSVLQDWAERIHSAPPRVDFLIHNAAVIHPNAPLWEIDREALDAVVDINIKGTFNVLQAFLPGMLKTKSGIIVTLSSGAGRAGLADISGYCASKWAVEGLTKSLAAELPPGMAAIPLSPGIIDTDMLRSTFGESAGNFRKPDEWAAAAAPYILQLSTDQSGQSLTVPGG